VLVVNTCAFIESAKQESIDAILEAVARKERGEVGRVIVTGCLAQRYGAELAAEIPEVDAFLGIQSAPKIAEAVFGPGRRRPPPRRRFAADDRGARRSRGAGLGRRPEPGSRSFRQVPVDPAVAPARHRAVDGVPEGLRRLRPRVYVLLDPGFRGRHRSKPIERVLDEARRLVDSGACELNLIAQDTTAYGMDLYGELALPRLLEGLGRVPGLRWVRLLYCYPTMMTIV
jgi:ribosomal protein S12 methylthiotransferase